MIRSIPLCLVLVMLIVGSSAARDTQQPMSVAEWETRFLSVWNSEHTHAYDGWSKGNNSSWYYFLAYAIDGNTAMYEATCKNRYLDRALYYINNVVADARVSATIPTSQYQDSFKGWAAFDPPDIDGEEVPLYESYMWRYVTRLLRIIRQEPVLYNNPTYRSRYDALLHFTETHIFEKWYTRDPEHLYRSRTHLASHWAYIALDLWLITENNDSKAIYREVFTKINTDLSPYYDSSLRDQIIPNPQDDTAYFWDAVWESYELPGQDVSHGNGVLAYMIEAHDQGVYWTDADITGLKNLLVKVLWNGSYTEPAFSAYLDGSDHEEGDFQSDGFMKLGRYDADIQRIYEQYTGQESYLTQFYGNGALNARRLNPNKCMGSAAVPSPTAQPVPVATATMPASTPAKSVVSCSSRVFFPMVPN